MDGGDLSRRDGSDWLERLRGAAPRRLDPDWRGARVACGTIGAVVALGVWELVSRLEVLPAHSFPPASVVLADLVGHLGDGTTWAAVRATMHGWAVGLVIAVPAAIVAGMVIGVSDTLYAMTRPIIEFLRPVPSVALIPVGVLLFGVGLEVKVFLIVYAVFFPVLYQAIYGVRSTDRLAVETVTMYGLGRLGRARWVLLPSMAPYLMTGLRLASSIALVLAVTAELVVGTAGIGSRIAAAQSFGEYSTMYGFILLTGALGVGLNAVFRALEARVVWWSPERRALRST